MVFESVDALQRTLADTVFHYTSDRKKAAGRALGTLVELITYYTLRAWNLGSHIVIGRYVPEFANPEITHEVEFSLHPINQQHSVSINSTMLPLTPAKVKRQQGPQTIEKAKQGAYVARAVSALQKVRLRNGQFVGVLERPNGTLYTKPYSTLLREIIDGSDPALLSEFILTVGVASNHGNWFTSQNPNKELRVLAQSYDWLLFLTDAGLAQFIDKLLLKPTPELTPARVAFLASYSGTRGVNRFTKVRIGVEADQALRSYFNQHDAEIETWFNVIAPVGGNLKNLQSDLRLLAAKEWKELRNT